MRSRIDLKYALGLELGDPAFDFSVLCEFRARLLAGGRDQNLLEVMLEHLHQRGLVKARGKQRTDSTHVLAAVRSLNRLEFVGETMRATPSRGPSFSACAPSTVRRSSQVDPITIAPSE